MGVARAGTPRTGAPFERRAVSLTTPLPERTRLTLLQEEEAGSSVASHAKAATAAPGAEGTRRALQTGPGMQAGREEAISRGRRPRSTAGVNRSCRNNSYLCRRSTPSRCGVCREVWPPPSRTANTGALKDCTTSRCGTMEEEQEQERGLPPHPAAATAHGAASLLRPCLRVWPCLRRCRCR